MKNESQRACSGGSQHRLRLSSEKAHKVKIVREEDMEELAVWRAANVGKSPEQFGYTVESIKDDITGIVKDWVIMGASATKAKRVVESGSAVKLHTLLDDGSYHVQEGQMGALFASYSSAMTAGGGEFEALAGFGSIPTAAASSSYGGGMLALLSPSSVSPEQAGSSQLRSPQSFGSSPVQAGGGAKRTTSHSPTSGDTMGSRSAKKKKTGIQFAKETKEFNDLLKVAYAAIAVFKAMKTTKDAGNAGKELNKASAAVSKRVNIEKFHSIEH